jgi:hypothetical protein
MPAKINDLVGTSTGFPDDAGVDTFIATRGWTKVKGWKYYDSTLGILKIWDGAAWGATGFVTTDGTQPGATTGVQDFGTLGLLTNSVGEFAAGQGVNVNGSRHFGARATDPAPVVAAIAGDSYYNTDLEMSMVYDATRGKWLSTDTSAFQWASTGDIAPNTYLFVGNVRVSANTGYVMPWNATVVAMGLTRSDVDTVDLWLLEAGVWKATLTSKATMVYKIDLNANLSANSPISLFNSGAGGTNVTISNTFAWMQVRWRL